MKKKIKINKDQFIASLGVAAFFFDQQDEHELSEIIRSFNEEFGHQLQDDWDMSVTLTDYEKSRYQGGGDYE